MYRRYVDEVRRPIRDLIAEIIAVALQLQEPGYSYITSTRGADSSSKLVLEKKFCDSTDGPLAS
jgi:hypothetical protein